MNEIYNKVLDVMDEGLSIFVKKVPGPKKVPFKDHFVYCYTEKSIHQAIILKLVRMISGLRATKLLAEHGFVQEQASLQHMLDEIIEDYEKEIGPLTEEERTTIEDPDKRDRIIHNAKGASIINYLQERRIVAKY